jgi:transcriptional regulator with XRE-family HTH domain
VSKPNDRVATQLSKRVRSSIGADVARLREDAGLSRAELGRGAGVDSSYLRRIEDGGVEPSVTTYARLAVALGGDLALRLYPQTGPTLRDRHQARIAEALLRSAHPRWHPYLEIAVRYPSRGWIDVGLHDGRDAIFVATEIQSEIRRLEQLVRWASEKTASLPSWEGFAQLGSPAVSQLLIIRDTRTTRAVARGFRRVLGAAYPANAEDALDAISGPVNWPGSAILWATGGRGSDPFQIVARR